jgi:adenosylcobyric acid synthase
MTDRVAAVMIQGTGSNVGKSTLVAGLARLLVRRGLRVAPFKPQNMSNNAAVAVEGGEIGRAQAVQARAARLAPSVHMNPVLLKPETDTGAQVIVQGNRVGTLRAPEYAVSRQSTLLPAVLDSFARLARDCDIILVEGAGSPAEINLRAGDIANMGFAAAADVPVLLAGDIDRGGVIASIVGTHAVLEPSERARIRGFLINKFRGDLRLFDDGVTAIERLTGWPSLGVVPWLPQAAWLPAEDAVDLERASETTSSSLKVVVPMLSRIANFDDLDPLGMEPGVRLEFVRPGQPIPADADVVILPGSKSTIGDLAFLCTQGWDIDIKAHARRGGHVLGLCGGYQMLGHSIADPLGIEGPAGSVEGLGLLDVATQMTADKSTIPVQGRHCATGARLSGYEIHLGRTEGPDCARPMLTIGDRPDGAASRDGRVCGTYVHGLFGSDEFRRAWLAQFSVASEVAYEDRIERALDALADHLDAHLDVDRIVAIARSRQSESASAA